VSKWNTSKIGNRALKDLLTIAVKQGCTVEVRNGGHLKVTAPSGQFIFTSQTPSDVRAFPRIKRDLKRIGVVLDKGKKNV